MTSHEPPPRFAVSFLRCDPRLQRCLSGSAMPAYRHNIPSSRRDPIRTLDRACSIKGPPVSHQSASVHPAITPVTGQSPAAQLVTAQVARLAQFVTHVLLVGEPGTEHERVARALHAQSPWRANPFVSVSVKSMNPEEIAHSLFGVADLEAPESHRALLAAADGGSLFIDEVTHLPLAVQASLARAIDRGEYTPVGGLAPRQVLVRLVVATELDSNAIQDSARIDTDLVMSLTALLLPPLRDRIEDIPELALECLRELGVENRGSLSGETVAALRSRPWQGNLSEFRAAVTTAQLTAKGEPLRPEHFPLPAATPQTTDARLRRVIEEWVRERAKAAGGTPGQLHRDLIREVERALIGEVLRECRGRLLPAARRLGLSRMTLRRLVRAYFS